MSSLRCHGQEHLWSYIISSSAKRMKELGLKPQSLKFNFRGLRDKVKKECQVSLPNSVSVLLLKNEVYTRKCRVLSSYELRAAARVDRRLVAGDPAHPGPGGQAGPGPAVGRAGGRLQGLGQLQTPGGRVSRLPGAPWSRGAGGQHHRHDV